LSRYDGLNELDGGDEVEQDGYDESKYIGLMKKIRKNGYQ